jgi:hypothetical protein
MNRLSAALVAGIAVGVLAGCGSSTPAAVKPSAVKTAAIVPADATAVAAQVKAGVSSVAKIVTITEGNDGNNLIGRPNGYTSAAVLYEKSVTCTSPGASCGATVEMWPTTADASRRAAYLQAIFKATPMLGTEWDYLKGSALLRVDGNVKPSLAKTYNAAFGGALVH